MLVCCFFTSYITLRLFYILRMQLFIFLSTLFFIDIHKVKHRTRVTFMKFKCRNYLSSSGHIDKFWVLDDATGALGERRSLPRQIRGPADFQTLTGTFLSEGSISSQISIKIRIFFTEIWTKLCKKYRVLHVEESFKIPISDADNFLNLFSSSLSIDIHLWWKFSWYAISSVLCEAVDRKTNRHTNKPRILHNLLGARNDQLLWNP